MHGHSDLVKWRPNVWVQDRVLGSWRADMHRHGARFVKWEPNEWVLDSGAWIHHTSKLELLLEGGDFKFQEMDNKDAPSSGDDDAAAPDVQGYGSVRTEFFDFPGVHYVVGDDTRNVVSVSQLARDHGLVTVFEPTSCHVKDKKTGLIIGKGRLHNGMYMLDSLRINGQYIGDGGASSGGEPGDEGGGGRGHRRRGNNGEGYRGTGEGRGGGGRSIDGNKGGGTGASRNQEQGGSGSAATGGDIKDEEIVTENGSSENEIQEMNDGNVDKDDNGKVHQQINGNSEEEDKKRGGRGPTFGGWLGLSSFACVLCMCITVCIFLLLCTNMGKRVICKLATFNKPDFLFISGLQLLGALTMMQSTCRELVNKIGSFFRGRRDEEDREGTAGDYVQESSQEYNRRLFGLSRFDVTADPNGHLPARAFASSTNTARQEDFFVDSGASFHTTWNESILFPYPQHLHGHTKPPTLSLGGIAAGSITIKRSGYMNGNNIMLDGVLLAPEAQANLVSVGQLSIHYRVQVEMDDVGVVIKKKRNGVQIGGGRILNNLYVLDYFLPPRGLFAHYFTPHP